MAKKITLTNIKNEELLPLTITDQVMYNDSSTLTAKIQEISYNQISYEDYLFTIPASYWTSISEGLYKFKAEIDLGFSPNDNDTIELINNQYDLFSTYVFNISDLTLNIITIVANDAPTEDIELIIRITQNKNNKQTQSSVNRNIGEIVTSTIPINDVGLHLLDGSILKGNGQYKSFVDYMINLYNNQYERTFYKVQENMYISDRTMIKDGVVSNFSSDKYVQSPEVISLGNNWIMHSKFTTGSNITSTQTIFGGQVDYTGFHLNINSNKLYFYLTNNETNWDVANAVISSNNLASNTTYYLKIQFDGNNYTIDLSYDNETWNNYITVNSTSIISDFIPEIGSAINGTVQNFLGKIDLSETYYQNETSSWYPYKKIYYTYKQNFTTEEEWQNDVKEYGSCGRFVYNEENNTIRLPKIENRFLVSGQFSEIGDIGGEEKHTLTIAELPSHTHTLQTQNDDYNSSGGGGRGLNGDGSATFQKQAVDFILPTGDNQPHNNMPPYIKVLYYIVISNTIPKEFSLNINGKADIDANNLTEQDVNNWQDKLGNSLLIVDYTLEEDANEIIIDGLDINQNEIYDFIITGDQSSKQNFILKLNNNDISSKNHFFGYAAAASNGYYAGIENENYIYIGVNLIKGCLILKETKSQIIALSTSDADNSIIYRNSTFTFNDNINSLTLYTTINTYSVGTNIKIYKRATNNIRGENGNNN